MRRRRRLTHNWCVFRTYTNNIDHVQPTEMQLLEIIEKRRKIDEKNKYRYPKEKEMMKKKCVYLSAHISLYRN